MPSAIPTETVQSNLILSPLAIMIKKSADSAVTTASLPNGFPTTNAADAADVSADAPVAGQPNGDTAAVPPTVAASDGPTSNPQLPNGFVLTGPIKLFGKIDAQLYTLGDNSAGVRQIVTVDPLPAAISKYIPGFIGSTFEPVLLQNTQFIYNENGTTLEPAGMWIQAEVSLSGPLESVGKIFKTIFHQDKPLLRIQGLLAPTNDWEQPPHKPTSLSLRGSVPGGSIKLGDIVQFTDISLAIEAKTGSDGKKYDCTASFNGTLLLETPHQLQSMILQFSLSESAGVVTLLMNSPPASAIVDFCGISGLKLSDINFSYTFALGSGPSQLDLKLHASLILRDTTLLLDGHYSKSDWSVQCELKDFSFDSLRKMYEDTFSASIHTSDHDIVLDDLLLVAGPQGINIDGKVTIEGHTAAKATINLSGMGVHITGEVDNVQLATDIALEQATLDVFIGRTTDTTIKGPGTSFKFAITGKVTVKGNTISVSLYLDKAAGGKLIWTAIGMFEGSFSLSNIAHELKDTPLDMSLSKAAFIASNVDGVSATGADVPTGYDVVAGVQVAATLAPISRLDKTLGNKGAPTSGMVLKAVYSSESSSFSLDIVLSVPQTMSMKNGTMYSGPISLELIVSTNPTLVLNADFFVKVPNQDEPLKFSGGIKMNAEEAELFIELQNQFWTNPFGLSKNLKLGPDLALQIGIVYVGPLYPSEIGVAAGLAIGHTSGKAALSISEAPNDELIMMEVDNLGVRDVVEFASTIFDKKIPEPEDFINFKQVKFYLSTGTTIGTIVYPPGASFSCDATLFGVEGSIFCGVDKSAKSIAVKGSLSPIEIGPLSISGAKAGTNVTLDIELGADKQVVAFSGAIHLLDLLANVDVNANLLPTPTFDLSTELDFSTHLTFLLEAHMRGGSFKNLASLKELDFDIHAAFHQDILDWIVAQVNMQVIAGKHALDNGLDSAQHTLDQAQADFKAKVAVAQADVDAAKKAYDAKAAQVHGAFDAEQKKSQDRTKQLQADIDRASKVFNDAIDAAKRSLQTAKENEAAAITRDQAKVDKAKKDGDAAINGHLKDLNNAKADMQRRFGDAINTLNSWQQKVKDAEGVVSNAQRDLDNAKREKNPFKKGADVLAAGVRLESAKVALASANGFLDAAKAVVSGPGYQAALASIKTYETAVEAAKSAANASLDASNATLQETKKAQATLVQQAQDTLTKVSTAGSEFHAFDLAKGALSDFQKAESGVLAGLQAAVDGLAKTAEAVAFGAANGALAVALANTKDIDIAKGALDLARHSGQAFLDMSAWLAKNALNIMNIKTVEVTGDLRGLCKSGTELKAHIVGTFGGSNVDFSCDFLPGKGEELAKAMFTKLVADVKGGVLKIL